MTIDISLQSKFDQVVNTSKNIRQHCNEREIPSNLADEVELCVIEALNNIIEHSYDSDPNNTILVEIKFDPTQIEIQITDKGHPRKNLETPKLKIDPDDIDSLPERGMGLFIIYELMDEVNYHSNPDSNTFSMIKKIIK